MLSWFPSRPGCLGARRISAACLALCFHLSEDVARAAEPTATNDAEVVVDDGETSGAEEAGSKSREATPVVSDSPWAKGVSAEAQAKALRLFQRGNEWLDKRNFEEARGLYLKALAEWAHPAIHFNLVICEVRLNQPLSAHEHIKEALAFGEAPLGAELYDRALTYEQLIKGQVARLIVSTRHNKVDIRLDGEPLLSKSGSIEKVVLPGAHQLVARKEGFVTFTEDLTLVPGEPLEVDVKMISLVDATEYRRPMATWVPWTVAGAGALGVLFGVSMRGTVKSKYDLYESKLSEACADGCYEGQEPEDAGNLKPIPEDVAKLEGQAKAWDVASVVTISAGGVALATGITLMILNSPRPVRPLDRESPRGRMKVEPSLGPTGGGLDLSVIF